MSSRARSRPLAIATVGATLAGLGFMYLASVQMKNQEGQQSIYKDTHGNKELNSKTNDARMNSSDVRAAVQGDKKR